MTDHSVPPKPDRVLRCLVLTLLAAFGTMASLAMIAGLTLKTLNDPDPLDYRPSTLLAWLAFLSLPMLILAPVAGAVADSSRRKGVLIGLAGGLFLLAVGIRFDAQAPLLSLFGVFASGSGVCFVCLWVTTGELLAKGRFPFVLHHALQLGLAALGMATGYLATGFTKSDVADCVMIGTGLAVVACLFLPGHPDPKPDRRSLFANFLRGLRGLFAYRSGSGSLVGLLLHTGIVAGVLVFVANAQNFLDPSEEMIPGSKWSQANHEASRSAMTFLLSLTAGAILGALQRNPFRVGMLVFYGNILALIGLGLGFSRSFGPTPLILLGLGLGSAGVGLSVCYRIWSAHLTPGMAAAWGLSVRGIALFAIVVAVGIGADPNAELLDRIAQRNPDPTRLNHRQMLLLGTLVFSVIWSCLFFLRATLEGTAEAVMLPVYRIRMKLAGDFRLPLRGPCLVIANHAAWFDPLWLGKVVPFPTTPMMTSSFYDLPVIRQLMKIIGTIRVPEATMRKEAPELQLAIDALDRGECVVIFPEGYLRRKEDVELRRFGRGVWHILSQRPATPVYPFWVEGGWGSFGSYKGGPPTKNKKLDFWRRVRIGGIPPVVVDPEILKDHISTRFYLMEKVAEARAPIGLPPLIITRPTSTGDDE